MDLDLARELFIWLATHSFQSFVKSLTIYYLLTPKRNFYPKDIRTLRTKFKNQTFMRNDAYSFFKLIRACYVKAKPLLTPIFPTENRRSWRNCLLTDLNGLNSATLGQILEPLVLALYSLLKALFSLLKWLLSGRFLKQLLFFTEILQCLDKFPNVHYQPAFGPIFHHIFLYLMGEREGFPTKPSELGKKLECPAPILECLIKFYNVPIFFHLLPIFPGLSGLFRSKSLLTGKKLRCLVKNWYVCYWPSNS